MRCLHGVLGIVLHIRRLGYAIEHFGICIYWHGPVRSFNGRYGT